MFLKRLFLLVLTAVFLSSCATQGVKPDETVKVKPDKAEKKKKKTELEEKESDKTNSKSVKRKKRVRKTSEVTSDYTQTIEKTYKEVGHIKLNPPDKDSAGYVEVTGTLTEPIEGANLDGDSDREKLTEIGLNFLIEEDTLTFYNPDTDSFKVKDKPFKYYPRYKGYKVSFDRYVHGVEFLTAADVYIDKDGSVRRFVANIYPTDEGFQQTAKEFLGATDDKMAEIHEKIKEKVFKKIMPGFRYRKVLNKEGVFSFQRIRLYPVKPFVRYNVYFNRLAVEPGGKKPGIYFLEVDALTGDVVFSEERDEFVK